VVGVEEKKYVGRWEAWAERLDRKLERIEKDLLGEWRYMGNGRFGYWGDRCSKCERTLDCEACGPEYILVVRRIYKPGAKLALYRQKGLVADGDENVKKFLGEKGIPLPIFAE
jgi:hypothetical protein